MSSVPRVSVIIAVKAINDYIQESLPYLSALDYPNYEVLLIPDEDRGERLPGVSIIPSGPVGPAEKRDLAATQARGEILAFLDDDAYPREDWLRKAVAYFDNPAIAALGGPAVTPGNETFWRRASGAVYASWMGGANLRYRYIPLRGRDVDDFPSVNLFVRKDTFLALGGFDSHYWPGEDTKLCRDIVLKGYRIVYAPEVLVWHHRRSLYREHLAQVANYAKHRGFFARRLPETSRRLHYFAPSFMLSILLVAIPMGFIFPVIGRACVVLAMTYAVLLTVSAVETVWRERSLGVAVVAAAGVALTHLVYGTWFLRGLLVKELTR